MPTTPLGIWSPADSDDWDLTVDLAAMALSVDSAISAAVSGITSGVAKQFRGTAANRGSVTGMAAGDTYQETDGQFLRWIYRGSGWFIMPGQILGSMMGPGSNTTGSAGTQIGTTVSTIPLPIGQRFKITAFASPYNTTSAGNAEVQLRVRNNPADVSFATADFTTSARAYSAGGSIVSNNTSVFILNTTTVAAKVSAALYIGTTGSGNYGGDGTLLMIESA